MSTYGLVKAGDVMRIGVKGKMDTDWWCIWDNFKLIYRGFEAAYVQPALEEALTMIDPNQPMGKSIYEQALGAKERADAAIAAGDGKEMFKVLNDIYNLSAAITESVALFKELNDANESLMEAINMAEGSIDEASDLFGRIAKGIENHSFEDEEVPALLTEIKAMKTDLPEPVAPAINRCGMAPRSAKIACPPMSIWLATAILLTAATLLRTPTTMRV